MKKIISLICVLALVLSVCASLSVVNVSAAQTNYFAGFSCSGGAKITNGVLNMPGSNASMTATYNLKSADKYVLKFSMKLNAVGTTNGGVQIFNAGHRTGFYLRDDRLTMFAATSTTYRVNVGYTWHEYRFEIDKVAGTSTLYFDNQLLGTSNMNINSTASSIRFWAQGGHDISVENFQFWNLDNSSTAGVVSHVTPDEYTEAFVEDWKDKDIDPAWVIYDGPELDWDTENGVLNFDVVDGQSSVLYSAERPLKVTDNFDIEFDMQIREVLGTNPQFAFKGGGFNTYYHHNGHKITTTPADTNAQFGIIAPHPNGEWHTYKLERRKAFMTLFMDGKEIHTMQMQPSSTQTYWRMNATGTSSATCRVSFGKFSYTPYFPDVEIEKPYVRSEYAEGTDITLKAKVTEAVDYVDYYINGINVGRGYKENQYEYVYKNAKVGAYTVTAKIGDKESLAVEFFVKEPYDADVEFVDDSISLGEAATVRIKAEDIIPEYPISKVEYYVNNEYAGASTVAPFALELKGLTTGTHSVHAKITNAKNGNYFLTEAMPMTVTAYNQKNVEINREYMVDYKSEGSGSINIEDGYFKLNMKHSADSVTYETLDGAKTYNLGAGSYKAVVTSGIADVYYNGQFAFSFKMPRTANKNVVDFSSVADFSIGGTGVKATFFTEAWQGTANYDKSFGDFGVRHAFEYNPTDPVVGFNKRDNLVNYSVEFDKTDASDETFEYWDGEYHIKLEFKDGKIHTTRQDSMINYIKRFPYTLEGKVEPGYYRLTVARGMCMLWRDNVWMGSWPACMEASKINLKRTMTNPSASTLVAIKGTDDNYYYTDNFEGNTEMAYDAYWVNEDSATGTIAEENGNKFMEVTGKGRYYLPGLSQNTKTSFRAKVDAGSDFSFIGRYSPRYHIIRYGYDADKSAWYAEFDDMDTYGGTKYGKKRFHFPGTFEFGKWHDFDLYLDEFTMQLKCDGKTVIDTDEFYFNNRGFSFGVEINSGKVAVDDIYYQGQGKVSGGIRSITVNDGATYTDFFQEESGRIISTGRSDRYSDDEGETWSTPVAAKSLGYTTNQIMTQEGWRLRIEYNQVRDWAYISKDNGATWEGPFCVTEREAKYRTTLNGLLYQAKNGTIFWTTDEGGSEDFGINGTYYSNDGGYTWHESTLMSTENHGYNLQEIRIVDMPEPERIRLYARSWTGFIQYVESTDGGKTFSQDFHSSEFLAAMCTFVVRRDVQEEQTYYAIFNYDSENAWSGRYSTPRNRLILAVSYDGCKTWEFAADLINLGDYPYGTHRNHSLDVFGDTIYIGYNGDGDEGLLYAIDKTKLKSTVRFQECDERYFSGARVDEFSNRQSIVPKATGRASIFGNYVDVEVDGTYVSIDAMARAVGADMTQNGNAYTFKFGEDASVVFTEGASSYIVNGETKDFGSAIVKNGKMDIKAVSEIFKRPLYDGEHSWILFYNNEFYDVYEKEMANLV